jgi:hypothetical protein
MRQIHLSLVGFSLVGQGLAELLTTEHAYMHFFSKSRESRLSSLPLDDFRLGLDLYVFDDTNPRYCLTKPGVVLDVDSIYFLCQ